MSARRRQIAGPPVRSATAVWTAVADLVRDTLAPAVEIDANLAHDVVMDVIAVGRVLVSGGHLDDSGLTLVADPLRLDIAVVSGTDATTLNENLNTVPGAATATAWRLHLPAPASVGSWVADAVANSTNLTVDAPPVLKEAVSASTPSGPGEIDAVALAQLLGEDRP